MAVETIELLPESGDYDRFKSAVYETIPAMPGFVKRLLERVLAGLEATNINWRGEPQRRISGNGKPYWFLLGDGEWSGATTGFNEFTKAVLQLGEPHKGWTAGFNPGWMGCNTWVFNFTVAVPAI